MDVGGNWHSGAVSEVVRRGGGAMLALVLLVAGNTGMARAVDTVAGGPLPRELAGTWSVLAGDRTAPGNFQNPTGLAVDAQGNVYVDDTQNFRIEKLSPGGQVLAVLGDGGDGFGQFHFADGLGVDRAGNLYVADTENHRIQKLSPRGYPVGVWYQGGTAPGELRAPTDVAVDSAGNMYVADAADHRVQKLSPQGKPLASWGSAHPARGGLKLGWPEGLAVGGDGTVYVSDRSLGRLVKISPQGKMEAIWGGNQEFLHPQHLAVDRAGHVFVADGGHHRVLELTSAGRTIHVWRLGAHANPNGIALTPAGTLLVADTRNSEVRQYSLTGTKVLSVWGRSERAPGEMFYPTSVAVDPSGTVDVADNGNGRIERLTTTATPSIPVVLSLSRTAARRIAQPLSVAADASGEIYVVDGRKGGIVKLSPGGSPFPGWPASTKALPADPIGVAVDPHGDVYVADASAEQIWRFDSAGRLLGRWGGGRGKKPGQFRFDRLGPAGIAADGQGHIYVTDTNNNRVEKFTTNGKLLAVWDRFDGFPGGFFGPYGLATDSQGNVYVADSLDDAILELSPSGSLIASWGTQGYAPGQFRDPSGIAVDSAGRIYVADSNNDRIQVYTPLTAPPAASPVRVSGEPPLPACELPYLPSNVDFLAEPRLAVNPTTVTGGHVNVIGVWTQDLGRDNIAAYSNDGGLTWQETALPFQRCISGGLEFDDSSDPWVSFGPDGTAYVVGLGQTYAGTGKHFRVVADGIEIATSVDGGRTWGHAATVGRGASPKGVSTEVDKPTVVADPVHPGTAYVFWDSLNFKGTYIGWMVKTTNGGVSWTAPRAFLPADPGRSVAALHQPVIDPRTGTIYDFFSYARAYPMYRWHCHKTAHSFACGSIKRQGGIDYVAFVRSTDGGATWSAAKIIAHRLQADIPDYLVGAWIRTGVGIGVALNPADGSLHVVWADATYSHDSYDEVLTSNSFDGGLTWSAPMRVSESPAFNPSVAIAANGTVAVTYYAVRLIHSSHPLRQIQKHPSAVVSYMMQTSADGGATFTAPRPLFGSFNMNRALNDNGQLFIGDYQGLVSVGDMFHPFFVAGNPKTSTHPVDVFTAAVQP